MDTKNMDTKNKVAEREYPRHDEALHESNQLPGSAAGATATVPTPVSEEEAKRRFENDLCIRGEAAMASEGKLPGKATHEITKDGNLERKKFTTF